MTEGKTTTTRAKKAEEPSLNIYQRINAISKEAGALAPESKGGVPFAFRGIDGTVAHLTPFLHKYEVIAVPKVISSIITEREILNPQTGTPNGKLVKTTQLEVEYTFFGPDGDSVVAVTAGLADDFGDRSTAQAMSVAFRLALLQTFHLPTHTKEPEESGQDVINERENPTASSASKAPKAVAAAQKAAAGGAAPAGVSLVQLQGKAKALGQKLGKSTEELNKLGSEVGTGDWFNDAGAMTKLVKVLEDELGAK